MIAYKILTAATPAALEIALNAEPQPFKLVSFSGLSVILEKQNGGTPPDASVEVSKTAPDGTRAVTKTTYDGTTGAKKSEQTDNFDKSGTKI